MKDCRAGAKGVEALQRTKNMEARTCSREDALQGQSSSSIRPRARKSDAIARERLEQTGASTVAPSSGGDL
jgi:hypothetical protein